MQAVAEAIVTGECLSAKAIAEVTVAAGVSVDASSTCGLTADAIEFDPTTDGPIAAPTDEVAAVAAAPLPNPTEEKTAGELIQALIERTPIVDPGPVEAPLPTETSGLDGTIISPPEAVPAPLQY
jgi:hypothetical protein